MRRKLNRRRMTARRTLEIFAAAYMCVAAEQESRKGDAYESELHQEPDRDGQDRQSSSEGANGRIADGGIRKGCGGHC